MKTTLILHSQPADIAFAGATYLSSTDGLTDGKAARATRVAFEGGSLTDFVAITASWTTPTVLRGGWMILDRNVPAGARVEIRAKRIEDAGYTYGLGGNSLTARTVRRDDGTIAVAWAFDEGLDGVVGYELRIFDDAEGATYATGFIDIGEIFVGEGTDVAIRRDFSHEIQDPSQTEYSLGNQPNTTERKRAEVIGIQVCPVTWDEAYRNGDSLRRLRERLVGGRNCAIIVAFREPATGRGAINWPTVQATTWFGKCTNIGRLQSVSEGARWMLELTFRESPGRLVA